MIRYIGGLLRVIGFTRDKLGTGLALSILAYVATSCSMVQNKQFSADGETGCRGTAGSYFLAKSKLRVVVEEESATTTKLVSLEEERIPDRKRSYCLDFLGSPTSEDKLVVKKNEKGLLTAINANAEDKSEDIVNTLIGTGKELAKIAALRVDGGVGPASGKRTYIDTFDPFDVDEMLVLNHNLKQFGMCIYVPSSQTVVSFVAMENYCERRITIVQRDAALLGTTEQKATQRRDVSVPRLAGARRSANTESMPPPNYSKGILYRPRLPYPVYVLKQKNRKLPGGWYVLDKTEKYLENEAPVLSIGVDRTFFANRKTDLVFDEGALTNVTIDKGSELVGFVSIPLNIAKAIVSLPAEIITLKIRIGNKQQELLANRAALYRAQADLLDAQAKLLEAQKANPNAQLNPGTSIDPAGFGGGFRSASGGIRACTTQCRAVGGEAAFCQSRCTCDIQCLGRSDSAACARFCTAAN